MLEIRKAEKSELAKIAELEKEIFPDAWSVKSLEDTWIQNNAEIFIVFQKENHADTEMQGYVIFYYVLDEGEIARIAVSPSVRRQGVATKIYNHLVEFCEEKAIKKIMLEVRENNESAKAFYRKCGFQEDGIRKNYYDNPKENAVLMSVKLN